jgi:hypothetical protein
MANKHNGEVKLTAVDGREYILKFGSYALAELEDKAGRSFRDMLEELNDEKRFRVKTCILFIWAGLQEHHEDMTVKDAAALVDALGIAQAGEKLSTALVLAFPELKPKEGAAVDGDENPTGNRRQRRATAATSRKTR